MKERIPGERKGIRLYFWNLWYYFIPLIMVNFLFVLCCIPVVTIGPAMTAMSRICCLLADGQPLVYPIREFWDAFRGGFKQGFGTGLLCIGYLLMIAYSFWLLNNLGNTSLALRLILLLALVVFFMCMLYVFPQIAMLKLKLRQILGNAIRLMLVQLKESVAAVILGGLVILGPLYFWPMSMLLYIVLLFSAGSLVCCSFAWSGIGRYLVKEE